MVGPGGAHTYAEPVHINPNDPNYKNAAAKIRRRLAKAEQIAKESPPSERLLQVTPAKLFPVRKPGD